MKNTISYVVGNYSFEDRASAESYARLVKARVQVKRVLEENDFVTPEHAAIATGGTVGAVKEINQNSKGQNFKYYEAPITKPLGDFEIRTRLTRWSEDAPWSLSSHWTLDVEPFEKPTRGYDYMGF